MLISLYGGLHYGLISKTKLMLFSVWYHIQYEKCQWANIDLSYHKCQEAYTLHFYKRNTICWAYTVIHSNILQFLNVWDIFEIVTMVTRAHCLQSVSRNLITWYLFIIDQARVLLSWNSVGVTHTTKKLFQFSWVHFFLGHPVCDKSMF